MNDLTNDQKQRALDQLLEVFDKRENDTGLEIATTAMDVLTNTGGLTDNLDEWLVKNIKWHKIDVNKTQDVDQKLSWGEIRDKLIKCIDDIDCLLSEENGW